MWEWACRPGETIRRANPPHLPGAAAGPANSGPTPELLSGEGTPPAPGVATRGRTGSLMTLLKMRGGNVTGTGEMRVLTAPILEESSDSATAAQVYWRDFVASPLWKADQDSCGKCPASGDLWRPKFTLPSAPNPMDDLGWALLLWASVSSCGI